MRLYILAILLALFGAAPLHAGGGNTGTDEKSSDTTRLLRRSTDSLGSYPGGPAAKAPLATGYYVTDNDVPIQGPPWTAVYQFTDSTTGGVLQLRRILSGPTQRNPSVWTSPGSRGYEYFRNPNAPNDSTDNAFAGPIAIGFPFHYYGRRYDSFYVSTNGLIALSNRRYIYNAVGGRVGYDSASDDTRPHHSGGAAADTIPDNYGYDVVALGRGSAWYGKPDAGVMNPNNNAFPSPARTAPYSATATAPQLSVIAPLWGDFELSQYDSAIGARDDFGRVYWATDTATQRLLIYVVNMSMKGTRNIPLLNQQSTIPRRSIRADYQVTLDGSDSSVHCNYAVFRGSYRDPLNRVVNVPAGQMFRANATMGMQSHDREYTNYLSNADFGGAVHVNGPSANTPHSQLSVVFKQWKNVLRSRAVLYQLPNPADPGTWIDLPPAGSVDDYELLIGNPILGVVRPIGIVENVSSDVGPVNIMPQPIRARAVFIISDVVNLAAPPVYSDTLSTRPLHPIAGTPGVQNSDPARPNIDTLWFAPYVTASNVAAQQGRFRSQIVTLGVDPVGNSLGERWPFDDSVDVRLFGLARLELPLYDSFSDYSVSPVDGILPHVQRWVSHGAGVIDGSNVSRNGVAPHGYAGAANLYNPVCRLDRKGRDAGYYYGNQRGYISGDTLTSFPINLRQVLGRPALIISWHRGSEDNGDVGRWFSDVYLPGPEHAVYNTQKNMLLRRPDQLIVEFAEPSGDGISGITNLVSQTDWQQPGFGDPGAAIRWRDDSTAPRWGLFGGGGGSASDTTGRIVVDEFDAGKDFEYHRSVIPIPQRWWGDTTANGYFRFRLRLVAKNDGNPTGLPLDDADGIHVDNIMMVDTDHHDIETRAVHVDWPWYEAPASQARAIPLSMTIVNNNPAAAGPFGIAMFVHKSGQPARTSYSYYRYKTVISLPGLEERVEEFPSWNAQECGEDISPTVGSTAVGYTVYGTVLPEGGYDDVGANDLNHTGFTLRLGPTFAYDDGINDVSSSTGLIGTGLSLVPPVQDGDGTAPVGPIGGSGPGSLAMRFTTYTTDTIFGYQGWFGSANPSPDPIRYALHRAGSDPEGPPGEAVPFSTLTTERARGIPQSGDSTLLNFSQYVTARLAQPLVIPAGTYFLVVTQLAATSIELGADASRMGQVTTVVSDSLQKGIGNISPSAHPEMRTHRFWYQAGLDSSGWHPMITSYDNPGYPTLNWRGTIGPIDTYTRGSWIPMLRPFFGMRGSRSCVVDTSRASGSVEGPATPAISMGNRLDPVIPNPVRRGATVTFSTAAATTIRLEIVNAIGVTVRHYDIMSHEGNQPTSIEWDGCDDTGARVPAGFYLCRISGDVFTLAQRIVVMR